MANDAATVRATEATAEMLAELPSFVPPSGVGVYAASRDNARTYLRVELGADGALPPQSDVSKFWPLVEEVA